MFVIIGIVMFASVTYLLYAYRGALPDINSASDFNSESEEVKLFVESCLENIAKESLESMGYNVFNNPIFDRVIISEYLEGKISSKLYKCIDDFSIFENKGMNISNNTYTVTAIVGDRATTIKLDFPITIVTSSSEFKLNSFSTKVDFNYAGRRQVVLSLINIFSPLFIQSFLTQNLGLPANILPNNIPGISNVGQVSPVSQQGAMRLSELVESARDAGFTFNLAYGSSGQTTLFMNFPAGNNQPALTHTSILPQNDFVQEEIFTLDQIPPVTYSGSPITFNMQSDPGITYEEYSDYLTIDSNGQVTISGDIPTGKTRVLIKAINSDGEADYVYVIINH